LITQTENKERYQESLVLNRAGGARNSFMNLPGGEAKMHDILVALAFVAMVACPAIVAAFPKRETEDEA
jgi:hypothetical protein